MMKFLIWRQNFVYKCMTKYFLIGYFFPRLLKILIQGFWIHACMCKKYHVPIMFESIYLFIALWLRFGPPRYFTTMWITDRTKSLPKGNKRTFSFWELLNWRYRVYTIDYSIVNTVKTWFSRMWFLKIV